MKGSISEFELGIIRARMLDAARVKARCGELRISVPIGYIWHPEMGLGLDPNVRAQEAIRLIFACFRQLGSARQVLLSLAAEKMHFARPSDRKTWVSRLGAHPLSQRDRDTEEPFLRRCLHIRKDRASRHARRWTCTQDVPSSEAFGSMGGYHQGSATRAISSGASSSAIKSYLRRRRTARRK